MPAIYPPLLDVANLGLALYKALDESYPRMPFEEQRLLRHTLLDQTRPWEALATDMPTLRAAIAPSAAGLVHTMPGTLADALFAPAIIWALTQEWIPNQASMVETALTKWSAEHVHNEDLRGPHLEHHIQLMRMFHTLLQQLPFGVDPLVYAKVLSHTKEVHRPYGVDNYEDDTPGVWLQWLARTAIIADAAIQTEMGVAAHDVWHGIAYFAFSQASFDMNYGAPHSTMFDSILSSTLPAKWRLLTLREAHPDYWSLPQFAPRLSHLLSRRLGQRILELPWRQVHNSQMQFKAVTSNHLLAKTFLPQMYPALCIVLKEETWSSQIGMVQALLAHTFSMEETAASRAEKCFSAEGLFDAVG